MRVIKTNYWHGAPEIIGNKMQCPGCGYFFTYSRYGPLGWIIAKHGWGVVECSLGMETEDNRLILKKRKGK